MLKILSRSRHCWLKSQNENLTREGWQDMVATEKTSICISPLWKCESKCRNSIVQQTAIHLVFTNVCWSIVLVCDFLCNMLGTHTISIKCLVFSVSHKPFKAPLSSRGCKFLMFFLPRLCPHFQNCYFSFLWWFFVCETTQLRKPGWLHIRLWLEDVEFFSYW